MDLRHAPQQEGHLASSVVAISQVPLRTSTDITFGTVNSGINDRLAIWDQGLSTSALHSKAVNAGQLEAAFLPAAISTHPTDRDARRNQHELVGTFGRPTIESLTGRKDISNPQMASLTRFFFLIL